MAYISEEELKNFLGKQLNDEYGRNLGKVIGLRINDYGQLQALEVEKGSGNLAQYPIDLVTIDKGSLFILPDWKVSSETVQKELDRVIRRIRALGELLQEHQIPPNIYDELKGKQEETMKELIDRKTGLMGNLKDRIASLDKQVDELIRFLINVKMEYRAGLIDESALTVACDAIEPNLKPILQEKKEISTMISDMQQEPGTQRQQPSTELTASPDTPQESIQQPEQGTSLTSRKANTPIQIQLEG